MEILGLVVEFVITFACLLLYFVFIDKIEVNNKKLANIFQGIKSTGGSMFKWMALIVTILMFISLSLHIRDILYQ